MVPSSFWPLQALEDSHIPPQICSFLLLLLLGHWVFKIPENPKEKSSSLLPESSPRVDVSSFPTSQAGKTRAAAYTTGRQLAAPGGPGGLQPARAPEGEVAFRRLCPTSGVASFVCLIPQQFLSLRLRLTRQNPRTASEGKPPSAAPATDPRPPARALPLNRSLQSDPASRWRPAAGLRASSAPPPALAACSPSTPPARSQLKKKKKKGDWGGGVRGEGGNRRGGGGGGGRGVGLGAAERRQANSTALPRGAGFQRRLRPPRAPPRPPSSKLLSSGSGPHQLQGDRNERGKRQPRK